MKIGPQLPKLLSNIEWLTFLEHGVVAVTMQLALHTDLSDSEIFDDQKHRTVLLQLLSFLYSTNRVVSRPTWNFVSSYVAD